MERSARLDLDSADALSGDRGGKADGQEEGRPRGWIRRLLLALTGVALAAAAFWYGWLPQYRPPLADGERYGIDVSHHQGPIDWEEVAASDEVGFAYIKATEGATHVDTQFTRNWDAAATVGIPRGAYHFFTLCRTGAEQADNFLRVVPDNPGALPPAVDLELAGNCAARPDRDWVHAELAAFLNRVEEVTGQHALLYLGPRFDARYEISANWDRPVWRLSLLRRPDMREVTVWQVSGFAWVDGIRGRVDLNVADLDVLLDR